MTVSDHADQSRRAAELVAQAERSASENRLELSDRLFQQALQVDPRPASRIAYGVSLSEQERYFEAISVFTPVLDGSDQAAIAIVCHNLAAIYRDIGDLDLARRFQWRATLLNEDLGPEELLGMANDAWVGGHADAAESLIVAADSLRKSDSDSGDDPDLIATWGLFKAAQDSPGEGATALRAAYCQHRADNDPRRMGRDLLNLAIVFGSVNRHRAKRRCLQRAIHCFDQAGAAVSRQRAQLELARVDRLQKLRSFDARRN